MNGWHFQLSRTMSSFLLKESILLPTHVESFLGFLFVLGLESTFECEASLLLELDS